ncbi:hypothetical protein AHAS_AhasUnG0035700 [Arachis hypogaea]
MHIPPLGLRSTLSFKSQPIQSPNLRSHTSPNPTHGPIAPIINLIGRDNTILAETMAAINLGTSSKLLKSVSTPDLRHLGLKLPKKT